MPEQNHPLHASERLTVDRLLTVETPGDEHLVDVARLLMRFEGFPGAQDIRDDLERILRFWKLDRAGLHQRTRAIWAAGFRPAPAASEAVGSGFDTAAEDSA